MGAKVFLLVGYQDEDGDPIMAKYIDYHIDVCNLTLII